jgi:hypothetical protein
VDEKPKRLSGPSLTEFLGSLHISKVEPVGRSSASGERAADTQLEELLQRGDPVSPGSGKVPEDAATLERLFEQAGESACFALTPDGHLDNHQPIRFDPDRAAEQVIRLLEVDIAADDREEALAFTWLGLAYHDHDHPADFAGLVRDAGGDGKPKCCYVDVKGTRALSPGAQRSKLEERAQQRKFGCLAQTVTSVANNGFAGYPGHGKLGLIVTLLHNPATEGKTHAGYAMGWFFGIASNFQASAAVWGWGGALGVKLPDELQERLKASQAVIRGQTRDLLELLREYRDYSQFRNEAGQWDRESLQSTLLAMSIAARYLLMQEDPVEHAEQSVENLQPADIETRLTPEDFHPGESWGSYFGRKADKAMKGWREAEEDLRTMVARRRQRGHSDAEIAEDLNCTVEELLKRFPTQT